MKLILLSLERLRRQSFQYLVVFPQTINQKLTKVQITTNGRSNVDSFRYSPENEKPLLNSIRISLA